MLDDLDSGPAVRVPHLIFEPQKTQSDISAANTSQTNSDSPHRMYGGMATLPHEREGTPSGGGILSEYTPWIHGTEAVHLKYSYTGGVFGLVGGDKAPSQFTDSKSSYVGLANLAIFADTEKLGLWKNGSFYVSSLFSHGPSPTWYADDAQGVVVFAYETPAQVSEYWYEHSFLKGKLSTKVGKIDAGTDYFYLDATSDFLNSSYTCVPVTHIPTAPYCGWGVSTFWDISDTWCAKVGVFDGLPDGNRIWLSETGKVYVSGQIECHYSLFKSLPGFFYVGGFFDNVDWGKENGLTPDGYESLYTNDCGWTIGLQQVVYRTNPCDENDSRGLTYFLQLGEARQNAWSINKYIGTGCVLTGIGKRKSDSVGTGINFAYFGPDVSPLNSYESSYELYYKMQVTDNISLMPDFQYIRYPAGEDGDASVLGLVFQMEF
ncbi:MAG: carbohydrate porin [Thermoguttaceae bacterium]